MMFGQTVYPVVLQGLDPKKKYKIKEINIFPDSRVTVPENGNSFTGEYLMRVGLNVSSNRELTSAVIELTAE
jgi:alpha-galactosidase